MCAQFVSSWQKPRSFRSPATFEMMVRPIPSPPNSLSRNRKLVVGEITKGGFETIRSKRWPRTGSNRSPSMQSTATWLSAALNDAMVTARGFRSLATTRSAWRAARSAWIPHPAPRSSTEPTRGLIVALASSDADGFGPRTWSGKSGRIGDTGQSLRSSRSS
jgi:hypothetical protein